MQDDNYVYKSLSQDALDREYNNLNKVVNSEKILEKWVKLGNEACALLSCKLDIKYGRHERQSLDVFPTHIPGAPILAFFHGGYWSSRDKSISRFLAPFYVATGVNFVSVGYRLCPEVSIRDIIRDAESGLKWLNQNGASFDGDPQKLFVAGHSSGGHLTAFMCGSEGPDYLKGGCSISGIHDLDPIRVSFLNSRLGINATDVKKLSPVFLAEKLTESSSKLPPIIVAVGSKEGKEYLRQSEELAASLAIAKQPCLSLQIENGNHFSACEAFSDPASLISNEMLRLIFAPRF